MNANDLTTPIYMQKAASVLETLGDLEEALKIYKQIKTDYPNSTEGRNIDKYIARVEVKLEK